MPPDAPVHAARSTPPAAMPRACDRCRTRSFLLGALNARIEHSARDLPGLVALLEHDDEKLIQAIGGRHRESLGARRRAVLLDPDAARRVPSICPHTKTSPPPPTLLELAPSVERYSLALAQPCVAILGGVRGSEYGRHVAAQLAALLASAGVTVAAPLAEGVSAAAHSGVLAANAMPFAVSAGGLDVCASQLVSLRRRIERSGCLVAQLPLGTKERRWTRRAAGRVLVYLADLVVVVEAQLDGIELEVAAHARSLGRLVAAVPGRIGQRHAQGPHALLREGAPLVASAQDVLDLLYGVGRVTVPARAVAIPDPLRAVLDRVHDGEDTLETLLARGDRGGTLLALGQLETARLICRGASGRYVARL
jgi:DNA processing protein